MIRAGLALLNERKVNPLPLFDVFPRSPKLIFEGGVHRVQPMFIFIEHRIELFGIERGRQPFSGLFQQQAKAALLI